MNNKNDRDNKDPKKLQEDNGPEGVDKSPGEEKNKKEKVTSTDLKAKKVDADLSNPSEQPTD